MNYKGMLRVGVSILAICAQSSWSDVMPVVRTVTLQPHTILHVKLVPDLGSRFIFPFILDKAGGTVPFTLNMTNPVFAHHRAEGRNFFTVEIDPQNNNESFDLYFGNLFVTVGDYNISILLSSTNNLQEHISDYIFRLDDEKAHELIEEKIAHRVGALVKQYKSKMARLDQQAQQLALEKMVHIVRHKPQIKRVRENNRVETAQGDIVLEWHSISSYGKLLHIIRYSINNSSTKDIDIHSVAITATKNDVPAQLISGVNQGPQYLPAGKKVGAVFATDSSLVRDYRYQISLTLQTSMGHLQVKW